MNNKDFWETIYAIIVGSTCSHVLRIVDDSDAQIFRSIRMNDVHRSVRSAVIHKDYLNILKRLAA